MRSLLAVLFATSALTLAACGSDSDTASTADTPASSITGSTPPATSTTPESSPALAEADAEPEDGKCADVDPAEAKSADVPEPTGSLDASKRYLVTLETSCGDISIELDAKNDPKTANSFASLVKAGYYDKTAWHRVVPGFVIQGGDPAGNGSGGPSWKVVEAPPKDQKYTAGVVAMAKTGAEAAGTSGSQFFIVTGDDVGLPADYAVAGKVVKGQNIADLIAAQGTEGADGPPNKPVVLRSAKLSVS